MKPEEFTAYTARCFRGEPASCSVACPFHLDMRTFLDKAAKGKWTPAYKQLRNATVFPVIVAALCGAPCREQCQRATLGDEAIAVRDIEAAVLRNVKEQKPERYVIPPKEQRVAVVGAGLAGLACALKLAQERYKVTVFEKNGGWGGCLRDDARFADFDADIARQFSAVEAEFRYDTEVASLDDLAGYDAVFIATGSGGDSFGLLDSWDCAVYTTREPRVFLGGAVTGAAPVEAIAEGAAASRIIQNYLQTGAVNRSSGDYTKESCARYLTHEGAVRLALVRPSAPEGYTADEAREEAARCLQCDCDACIAGCEMLRRYGKPPKKLAVEAHADMAVSPFASRTLTREAYSCNLCGHCTSVCPEDVQIGGLLRASRVARMTAGVAPAAFHDFWLRELDFATGEGFFVSAPRGATTCEYLFYPGCQLGAGNPEHVLATYASLAATHDLGVMLGCCGAPAYWAGDDARVGAGMTQVRRHWEELGRPTLVFACATCSLMFGSFLPEVARVSVYELLARAGAESPGDDMAAQPLFPEMAVFDPCAARDDTGMESAVRELARVAGLTVRELAEKNRCCGHGGHIRVANPTLYDEIVQRRADAAELPYLVYCANCREVFAWRGKPVAHVLDVALGLRTGPAVPTLEQKRANSLLVKKQLAKRLQDVDFEPARHNWDHVSLILSPEMQQGMEQKLISSADLKEAIWQAESTGDFFYDAADGSRLASMVRPVITYWVQYRQAAPDTYEVVAAYSHRMRTDREERLQTAG